MMVNLSMPAFANNQYDVCFVDSAKKYNIDVNLLKAIAKVESSFNPFAINRNAGSEDIGIMQINSSWLPMLEKKGITKRDLFNPCVSIDVGSWVLAKNMATYGNTWNAVGAYNARSIDKRKIYAARVKSAYQDFSSSNVAIVENKKIRVI